MYFVDAHTQLWADDPNPNHNHNPRTQNVIPKTIPGLVVGQTVDDIEPFESENMSFLFAFECTQATPHSLYWKAEACQNMLSMLVTADTSHFDRSWLKE